MPPNLEFDDDGNNFLNSDMGLFFKADEHLKLNFNQHKNVQSVENEIQTQQVKIFEDQINSSQEVLTEKNMSNLTKDLTKDNDSLILDIREV